MIQFLGISKIYKSNRQDIIALDDVSFEIAEGEFIFLVGQSGSGKTSILKLIIREELPTSGRIYFQDNDITKLRRRGLYKLRRDIGVVFQDFKLIEDKNAYENIAFAMEAAGQSKREILETVPYVLDIVNLTNRANSFPSELSGGEKQKVAIARALSNNPKVLIADEPTGNLDPNSAWDIVQILAKINSWGTTVIMSTHGSEIVNLLQKRVLRMEKGKLVRDDKKGRYENADEHSLKVTTPTNPEVPELNVIETNLTPVSEEIVSEKIIPKEDENPLPGSEELSKKNEEAATINLDLIPSEIPDPETEEVEKIITKADLADLSILKLGKELEEKLAELGYHDVEDILVAGVAEVNNKLNKADIKSLARAIKKFVTTE